MPKASIMTKSGAKVTIEGTQDEVATLLAVFNGVPPKSPSVPKDRIQRKGAAKPTPMSLLSELIGEGFFKAPKTLDGVRVALREKGHFYPVTTLSPVLLRLVRKRELRRIKENKRWTYVG
jgi:hypothetical protein